MAGNGGTEQDFTELEAFGGNGIILSRREHQVAAMYAFGFSSDAIIAEHLGIKTKYVQAISHDLRKRYSLCNNQMVGRFYAARARLEW